MWGTKASTSWIVACSSSDIRRRRTGPSLTRPCIFRSRIQTAGLLGFTMRLSSKLLSRITPHKKANILRPFYAVARKVSTQHHLRVFRQRHSELPLADEISLAKVVQSLRKCGGQGFQSRQYALVDVAERYER